MAEPLLKVDNLKVHFPVRRNALLGKKEVLKAVDGISFELMPGEILGIVGESGCGKSTLARAIARLLEPTAGKVLFQGLDIASLGRKALRQNRRHMQMIFQDPLASLDPRMTVGSIVAEPLQVFHRELSKKAVAGRVQTMLEWVGLSANQINRYPHEFSGGQCQRIGIARAMILEPRLVICDEPVSALDVSIQAQIVNLLKQLQAELGLSLIFIAHDLGIVKHISDRVMVMYLGKTVEISDSETIYANPRHPYTRSLIDAIPIPDPNVERKKANVGLRGELPSAVNPPSGCYFHPRCPIAIDHCQVEAPDLEVRGNGRSLVACFRAGDNVDSL